MDAPTRTSIILAAVTAAGPIGSDPSAWHGEVAGLVGSITAMTAEGSELSKIIDGMTGPNSKVFRGHLVNVRRQDSSTRGIATLFTGTERIFEGVPAGCEEVRTERTDNPIGLAMAQRLGSLIGHEVVIWVEVQDFKSGQDTKKMRVVHHAQSLGLSREPMAVQAKAQRDHYLAQQQVASAA